MSIFRYLPGLPRAPHLRVGLALLGWSVVAAAAPAAAQNAPIPKFEAAKLTPDEPSWKAQAKGSLLVTSGNSRSRSGVFGFSGSRRSGATKLALEAQAAYGQSSVVVPQFDPANPMLLVGLGRQSETTTNQWLSRARADQFLSENNAAYLQMQLGADLIAGKERYGGAQLGYSRQLFKDQRHTAVAELGYDFSYERYAQPSGKVIDPVQIHSARVFLGEQLALSSDTGINASLEALFNLNKENALDASDPSKNEVAAFRDTRVIGKLGLSTTLWKNLSFAFGVTVKYDQNPAPQPLPDAAKNAMLAPSFAQPFAEKLDTLTEATLIVTFL